jgi:hypothetical protein
MHVSILVSIHRLKTSGVATSAAGCKRIYSQNSEDLMLGPDAHEVTWRVFFIVADAAQ